MISMEERKRQVAEVRDLRNKKPVVMGGYIRFRRTFGHGDNAVNQPWLVSVDTIRCAHPDGLETTIVEVIDDNLCVDHPYLDVEAAIVLAGCRDFDPNEPMPEATTVGGK